MQILIKGSISNQYKGKVWRLALEASGGLSSQENVGGKGVGGTGSQLVKDKSLSFLNERLIAEPGGQDEGWATTSQFREGCRRRIDRGLAICLDFRNSFRCSVSAIEDQSLRNCERRSFLNDSQLLPVLGNAPESKSVNKLAVSH